MISYLIGKPLLEKDSVTILTHGVGYGVRATAKTLSSLLELSEVELYIYTHVKEEALELYGFREKSERELFLLLLSVSGIGPKTALGILNFPTSQIIEAVQQADTALFTSVPRVGKKLAQKIIIDLRTQLGALKELDLTPLTPDRQAVFEALQSLGFADSSIHQVMNQVPVEKLTISEAITLAIRELGKK